jgi:antibiotic biosynthesis monooxygenase (ABM) superfamily enzyme
VVVRTWRGWTRAEDADRYVEYVRETGLKAYRETPGNRGAWILRRTVGDRCEFVTVSVWDSLDDIRGFAGDEIERGVFYPEDDAFLVERELTVDLWELWD